MNNMLKVFRCNCHYYKLAWNSAHVQIPMYVLIRSQKYQSLQGRQLMVILCNQQFQGSNDRVEQEQNGEEQWRKARGFNEDRGAFKHSSQSTTMTHFSLFPTSETTNWSIRHWKGKGATGSHVPREIAQHPILRTLAVTATLLVSHKSAFSKNNSQ